MVNESLLDVLYKELNEYIRDIYKEEIPMVFGGGNPESGIVLIGEAPGKHEILQGKPFVGQAGKNLDQFIEILGIDRSHLYITNVVKMRPHKINSDTSRESNRTPTKKEVNIFGSFLMKELEIIKPKLVVTLGNIALKCITQNDNSSIGVMHGQPIDITFGTAEFNLFPLYHPASIIYKADLKDTYLQDLYKLESYLRIHKLK